MDPHHSRTPFQQPPATFSTVDYLADDPHLSPATLLTRLEHQLEQIQADRSETHRQYQSEFLDSLATLSSLHDRVSKHLSTLDTAKMEIQVK